MKRNYKYNWQARSQHRQKRAKTSTADEDVPLSEELQAEILQQNPNEYHKLLKLEDGSAEMEEDSAGEGQTDDAPERRRKGIPTLDDLKNRRKKMSKKKIRRLEQVVRKKEKAAKRQEILATLAQHAVKPDQTSLLLRTAALAQGKHTAKQRLQRQLREERAGISVTASATKPRVQLNLKSRVKRADEMPVDVVSDSDSDSDSDGAESSGMEEDVKKPVSKEEAEAALKRQHEKLLAQYQALKKSKSTITVPGASSAQATFVHVKRKPEIQHQRMNLPILKEEHTLMESINANSVVIICGETGCGKTTQVPQFLYEAGYTRKIGEQNQRMLIGVTEPRRIAAVSMAQRVGVELNNSKIVAHQIRYDSTTTPRTELKFMTDGVLQKEIEADFALRKYSSIIVDEAHERSMHTDILLGLLSRIVPLREKMAKEKGGLPALKLIIMSATLRVEDFTKNERLFPGRDIPVLSVDARQFPVRTHFSKRTLVDLDNVAAAMNKVSQIHERLPPGGILVFMTGQGDIHDLCRKLKSKYPIRKGKDKAEMAAVDWEEEFEGVLSGNESADEDGSDNGAEDDDGPRNMEEGNELEAMVAELEKEPQGRMAGLTVLPLYSNLSKELQAKVFEPPAPGTRLCVIATNVAETSVTIPGVRYVVDGGQVKNLNYDEVTGVSNFVVGWTSKASSNQRSGRAGRTGPGHCYRLYSSAVFQHEFDQFSPPEILAMPIDGLVLQMKAMNIDVVSNFPFPTPPEPEALKAAEKLLVHLNALDKTSLKITPLGRAMSKFPVAPRYAKMLALAEHYDCLPHIVAIVSALTVKNLFLLDALFDEDEELSDKKLEKRGATQRQIQFWKVEGIKAGGDLGSILQAVGAVDFELQRTQDIASFCKKMCIRYKAVAELNKLRQQLKSKIGQQQANGWEDELDEVADKEGPLPVPSSKQLDAVRQICLAGFGDHVARLSPLNDGSFECDAVEDRVWIHPTSALAGQKPRFVVYHDLVQGKKRMYMKGVTVVDVQWLSRLVPNLCTFSKPLPNPEPYYNEEKDDVRCWMSANFGHRRWPLPSQELSFPIGPDRYRYFARAILEGKVFQSLEQFVPHLKNKPNIMNKPWTKERVVAFLQTLVDAQLDTKAKLLDRWRSQPSFLLGAYLMWLPDDQGDILKGLWPPSA